MKTAMILAAGRGERLKPLTLFRPKAMCLVHGLPLIEYHLLNLAKAGFERIIINHAYLGDQIRHYFGRGQRWGVEISYAPEPPGGLETGGGIFNALPLLGNKAFITVNADIVTDYSFANLALPEKSLAHLVLVKNPGHNIQGDFSLLKNNLLGNDRQLTYGGIACYHPQAFSECHTGRYSVVPLIRSLVNNHLVSGELFEGLWLDIGSNNRLVQANNLPLFT